jgi:WD40 repeat protein
VWHYTPGEPLAFEASQAILTIPDGGSAIFSPDGNWLAALSLSTASGNAVKLWDANTGQELLTMAGHTDWLAGLAFSPDGKRLASTSLDGTVRIWSLEPGREKVAVFSPIAGYGNRVVYSPNGEEFATNGGDGSATIWNAETGQPRLTLTGHEAEVMSMAFSPDGKRFATASLDMTAIIWDAVTGKKLLTLSGHEDGVRDIAFSSDGSLIATGGFDGTARVWDAATGTSKYTFTDYEAIVPGIAFSPECVSSPEANGLDPLQGTERCGTHLATSSIDGTAKIWDMQTGELSLTFAGGGPDIAYSPDGKVLATSGGDGIARLWNAETGQEMFSLSGHSAIIRLVTFSPDGKFVATGSDDNTAKLWDVATGEEIFTLPGSEGGVYGVAFRPSDDSSQIAIAGGDGIVRVFLLRVEDLLSLAETRVTRSLTTAECKKYLHVDQCPSEP